MSKRQLEADVVIVGAGPAGIVSAAIAAEQGRSVVLVEAGPGVGGQIWHGAEHEPGTAQARHWLTRLRVAGVTVLRRTTVIAAMDSRGLLADSPEGALELRGKKVVLAVGAREVFVPFPGWTLPNVVGAGGLQDLVKSGWPVQGKRVVVAGTGPLLFAVGRTLRGAGAKVVLIAEQAGWKALLRFGLSLPTTAPGKLVEAVGYQARLLGVPYRPGCWPVSVEGRESVTGVTLRAGNRTWTEPCDYLACGFGLAPNLELPALLGCRMQDGFVCVDECQQTSVQDVYCAGEPTGVGGVDRAVVEGLVAGYAVAGQTDRARSLVARRRRAWRFTDSMARAFQLRDELRHLATPETVVCRCEDVTYGQLKRHDGWRAAKLHTRCGMGPCQGRVCGCATQALFGWQAESVRPPLYPARVDILSEMG